MGKTGRTIVGVLALIYGIILLAMAIFWNMFWDWVESIPFGGEIAVNFLSRFLTVVFWVLIVIAIFYIVVAVGLFMDQKWAVITAMVLAIISLVFSILSLNCCGVIFSIIILWLLK